MLLNIVGVRNWGICSTQQPATGGFCSFCGGMNILRVDETLYMKNFLHRGSYMLAVILFTSVVYLPVTNAQDKKVEIDIGVDKEPVWYQQPWAWVLGAAIFILLLVALLRGGRKQ